MTSQTNPKTIELYGYGCQHEADALAAITPGMLVERADGGVQPHGSSGAGGNLHFANEYGITGRGIDDEYETDDDVIFTTYSPGAGVYGLVADGADAIAEGDMLASAGDGTLAKATTDDVVVAQALEAVDNSGGSDLVRIRVEVVTAYTSA